MTKGSNALPLLPPELWLEVFHHATHVPGTLVPEIYNTASLIGPASTKSSNPALREALVTKRALVRVCRQWWHLATPYLYRSVYIGRARCLSSLSSALARSAASKGIIVSTRPLGEHTQRLDVAIRDHSTNTLAESDLLAALITCMPHLAVVSFAVTANYAGPDLPNSILDALEHSAASLRVLNWSSIGLEPSAFRMVDLLAKCTQLRVLSCPWLVWSKELYRRAVPSSVTTLRLQGLIPSAPSIYDHIPQSPCNAIPTTSLQELILDLKREPHHWADFLSAYSSQLVSVHFYIYTNNIEGHLKLLARTCPRLRRLTLIFDRFSALGQSHLVFPPITYLGLRVLRSQSPKVEFELLARLLEDLWTNVPSLRVVQLLNERNVRCLLETHTSLAVRILWPFMNTPSRVEDKDGVALRDRLKALGQPRLFSSIGRTKSTEQSKPENLGDPHKHC